MMRWFTESTTSFAMEECGELEEMSDNLSEVVDTLLGAGVEVLQAVVEDDGRAVFNELAMRNEDDVFDGPRTFDVDTVLTATDVNPEKLAGRLRLLDQSIASAKTAQDDLVGASIGQFDVDGYIRLRQTQAQSALMARFQTRFANQEFTFGYLVQRTKSVIDSVIKNGQRYGDPKFNGSDGDYVWNMKPERDALLELLECCSSAVRDRLETLNPMVELLHS